MKKLLFTMSVFLAFAGFAWAQQPVERLDQQPPTVTEQEVAKHERIAQQAKKDKNNTGKKSPENKTQQVYNTTTVNTPVTKKASTKPGKQ